MNRPTSKPRILTAAVSLAASRGLHDFSRLDVAVRSRLADATVSYHFGDMDKLRTAVMEHAVKNSVLAIIAQGLVHKHPAALKAPRALRERAAKHLAS